MMELYPGYLEDHFNIHKLSGTGASPPEYMTTASTQYAPAPLRMGMYGRHHHHHQQPLPQPPQPAPVVGMWNSEPYKVDSGGQATSGSTIMEGDTKFDHTGLEEVPHMDELEPEGDDDDQGASKPRDKVMRRLAQNREAARKSRLRKKAYIQQLETSRIKLAQLEQELQRARQQQGGVYGGPNPAGLLHGGGFAAAPMDPGVAAFEIEYGHWVDEQKRHTGELRGALQAQATSELELRMLVETGLANYDHLFRIKSAAACADVFCVMSGLCRSPAERFFLWIGGFRPSEVLNLLHPQLQPLTDHQLMAVYKLQQSSAQAEDALSQGMEKLQQTLSASLLATDDPFAAPDAYGMGTNSAVEKLKGLVGFMQQADHLRQETLQNMHKILTTRQAARGLLTLGDYFDRLRALSSLWAARPGESATGPSVEFAEQLHRCCRSDPMQQGVHGGPNPAGLLHGGGFAAAPMDPGVAAFEIECGHWVDEQKRHTGELRGALQAQATPELELRMLVETGLANYDHLFRIKSAAACSDVFCVMSGLCRSPAERFFLSIGGFRPSEVLDLLHPQLQALTDHQLMAVYKLQQSSAQAEDALSQGMEKLQQTLSASLLATDDPFAAPDAYGMGTNSAVEKLKGFVGFVQQADYLRQETLQNMHKILTTQQAARGLLALGDYFERLRALSSLWAARPRESAIS